MSLTNLEAVNLLSDHSDMFICFPIIRSECGHLIEFLSQVFFDFSLQINSSFEESEGFDVDVI